MKNIVRKITVETHNIQTLDIHSHEFGEAQLSVPFHYSVEEKKELLRKKAEELGENIILVCDDGIIETETFTFYMSVDEFMEAAHTKVIEPMNDRALEPHKEGEN